MKEETTQEPLNTLQGAAKIRELNRQFSQEQEHLHNNFKCGLAIPEELAKQQVALCDQYQKDLLAIYRRVASTINESESFVRGNLRALIYNF